LHCGVITDEELGVKSTETVSSGNKSNAHHRILCEANHAFIPLLELCRQEINQK